MATATCPSCDSRFILRSPAHIGQRVVCDFCETELEVVSLKPLELDWPAFEDGDYFDEEDYDYNLDSEERW